MRRTLTIFALLLLAWAGVFAQTRENVRIYLRSVSDELNLANFAGVFRERFSEEIEGAGYGLAYRPSDSDYILNLTIRPNMVLYDDGVERRAPSNEKQSVLQFNLVRNRDSVEIVNFSFLFTDPAEVEPYNQYLFYQIMTNLPYFVQEYTPATAPGVEIREVPVPALGDTTFIIRQVPAESPPEDTRENEAVAESVAQQVARAREDALAQAREEAQAREDARLREEAQAREREEALAQARAQAREDALAQARQEAQAREEARLQEEAQAREREEALARARAQAREEALAETQGREAPQTPQVEVREVPVPVEVEVVREVLVPVEVIREVPVEVIKEVPVETQAAEAQGSTEARPPTETTGDKNSVLVDNLWRDKWLYLRASVDVPFSYFKIRPGQNTKAENTLFAFPPGATLGLELQYANWMSAELDFIARFANLWDFPVFIPGVGFQYKFLIKPADNFMLEPYLGATVLLLGSAPHSTTPYYLEAGGGFQFGMKAGPGAWFIDANFMHTFNNVLSNYLPKFLPNIIKEVSTNNPTARWNRFVVGLGVGYKMGFINR